MNRGDIIRLRLIRLIRKAFRYVSLRVSLQNTFLVVLVGANIFVFLQEPFRSTSTASTKSTQFSGIAYAIERVVTESQENIKRDVRKYGIRTSTTRFEARGQYARSGYLERGKTNSKKFNMLRPVSGVCTQGPHGKNKSGVDLRAKVGTPVYAAEDGEVVEVARHSRSGRLVRINHNNKWSTFYGHLSVQAVSVGELVERGTIIGLSGNTGVTTGPHLHFAVRGIQNPFCR